MKFVIVVALAVALLISIPFSNHEASSASGQVVTKTKRTSKKVGRKTWRGTKRVGHTARVKSQPARRKTWRTGRKVVSRTKKILF